MNIPDFMPMIRVGPGDTPKDGGCLVQVCGYLSDGVSWTDSTPCVHPMLRFIGIKINDLVDDEARQKLLLLAPRLIGTGTPAAPDMELYTAFRIADFAVSQINRPTEANRYNYLSSKAVQLVAEAERSVHRSGPFFLSTSALDMAHAGTMLGMATNCWIDQGFLLQKSHSEMISRFEKLIDVYDTASGRKTEDMKTVTPQDWAAVKDVMAGAR